MSKEKAEINLHSIYQWEDMREEILSKRYPNLWEEYKDKEPINRDSRL
jgi:hypothetical protein